MSINLHSTENNWVEKLTMGYLKKKMAIPGENLTINAEIVQNHICSYIWVKVFKNGPSKICGH